MIVTLGNFNADNFSQEPSAAPTGSSDRAAAASRTASEMALNVFMRHSACGADGRVTLSLLSFASTMACARECTPSFSKIACHVIAHGLLADEELAADLDVRAALRDPREDLALARR